MGNLNYPDKIHFFGYQNKVKVLTFPIINQTLNQYSQNGYLSLQNFNEVLSHLTFDDNFPRLAYTYLSEKLFGLLDTNKSGMIDNESFLKGICMAISSQETRMTILFEAMKTSPKQYLTFEEVFYFFLQSWKSGFNFIFSFINYYYKVEFTRNNIPLPQSQNDFAALVNRHKEDLSNYLVKNLYDSGIYSNQQITYEMFRNWAMKDNTIEIVYANKVFRFATSILFMESIGLNVDG